MLKQLNILVLGATGFTGQLIVDLLIQDGHIVTGVSRNLEKLEFLKVKYPENFNLLRIENISAENILFNIEQSDLIVNCFGPFNVYGIDIVKSCVQSGKIYFDITGEQHFVYESMQQFSQLAVERKSTIVHSLAFESTLTDILLNLSANSQTQYQSFNSYYQLENSRPSPGTRITMKVSSAFPTFHVRNFQLQQNTPDVSPQFDAEIAPLSAVTMSYPEVLFAQKEFQIDTCNSFLLLNAFDANYLAASRGNNQIDVNQLIEKHIVQNPKGPELEERQNQEFKLLTILKDMFQNTIAYELKGKDMYLITAQIIQLAVLKIIKLKESNSQIPVGVITPFELLGKDAITWLENHEKMKLQKLKYGN